MVNLDTALLRTLVTAVDHGNFARAAERVGRTQSAVSLQMRRLEEQVGQTLLRRQGRVLVLTDAGEAMLAYARRILELNDEAVQALGSDAVTGSVRVGLPQDFAETGLPAMLAQFSRIHPGVRVEARVDRTPVLMQHLRRNELDLALTFGAAQDESSVKVATRPVVWIAAREFSWSRKDILPLALFEAPCVFRDNVLSRLESAGIAWRVAFTSPSLAGLWAAVEAGLGVTVRTPEGVPSRLRVLDRMPGLPRLSRIDLHLHLNRRPPTPAAERLREVLLETLRERR
jgi:DNA-binding transcriptional LysR family regulator